MQTSCQKSHESTANWRDDVGYTKQAAFAIKP